MSATDLLKPNQHPETGTEEWDLAIIGGGFRTTTFLSYAPELLKHRITIIEKGNVIGPGAFQDYTITTSSAGGSMLKNISFRGPFEKLRNSLPVNTISACKDPVRTADLSKALSEIGDIISDSLDQHALRKNTCVSKIELDTEGKMVTLHVDRGETIHAKHVLIATGRYERPHKELAAWQSKVMLSGSVISKKHRKKIAEKISLIGDLPIVIAGCSHSAMSALQVILEISEEIQQENPVYKRPEIIVLQRNLTPLMYESKEQAHTSQVIGRERIFNPQRDICPETGIVFRDSGLRHKSKELYCSLYEGEIRGATLLNVKAINDASSILDNSGFIIQALGYYGNVPDIYESDKLIRSTNSNGRLFADEEGCVVIGGKKYDNLSVIRVEPTPVNSKDNAAYGSGLYEMIYARLDKMLTAANESRQVAKYE
ncbi:hypothetical protein M3204_18295 [Mesobacillus subterraneus]|uniref:FAD-dependent oxidoreductase n=1 Tax=Mesobacillus subterraneus TaxID=285983 RepID=UPI002041DF90|nr:FAD-dependent oxidoreductase [Mesobacillus subterraneus]MCM3666373.1 hypothetical protein [Mesobacillus subterraneus]MCM3685355.1 hypothetical protein [Mesobacillus subterraneus]